MAVNRDDPYRGFNFMVNIDGVLEAGTIPAGFSEVSGLGAAIPAIEYRTGQELRAVRKLPGLPTYSNVVLKRGVTGDLRLLAWIKQHLDGEFQPANVEISLLNEEREPVVRFRLARAWPTAFLGPTLHGGTGTVAIETLELCHEGLTLA
jgi:phage tail-like protein